jgi:hypothetical protein
MERTESGAEKGRRKGKNEPCMNRVMTISTNRTKIRTAGRGVLRKTTDDELGGSQVVGEREGPKDSNREGVVRGRKSRGELLDESGLLTADSRDCVVETRRMGGVREGSPNSSS